MLVRSSQKLQPEFDLAEARRIFSTLPSEEDLYRGVDIASPYDLFAVETLRDLHRLRTGRTVPTDVFVFGKGEAPRRDCTKVGGVPYWPADRPWPRTPEGEPYLFLAQFNFADSRDLVTGLPGEVLLLLVADPLAWQWEPEQMSFEWLPIGLPTCSAFDEALICEKDSPFFGVIHRTADYPDARHLQILAGTKIGGLPAFVQNGEDTGGEFLCQLGSIQAAPDVPYPWVNVAESLGLEFDHRGIYGEGNSIVFGDMGTLYIFRDRDGAVRSSFECY
jgi:hypothetical protein